MPITQTRLLLILLLLFDQTTGGASWIGVKEIYYKTCTFKSPVTAAVVCMYLHCEVGVQ